MRKLYLNLKILTLLILTLSFNACFVKTSIPTTEVRIEPIRQLSGQEYHAMSGYLYSKSKEYEKKQEEIQKQLKFKKFFLKQHKLETIFDYDAYDIVKEKYIVGNKTWRIGKDLVTNINLIGLKKDDYKTIFSSNSFSPYFISDDEKYILICQDRKKLKIFDTDEDLKEAKEWEYIKCDSTFLSFDNRYLVANYKGGSRIYDFKTQELIYNNPNKEQNLVFTTSDLSLVFETTGYPDMKDYGYILFNNKYPQRFVVKEIDKNFIDFHAIQDKNRNARIYIHKVDFENNIVEILFAYFDKLSIKHTPGYYYLAKLVPIEKDLVDEK